MAKWIVDKSADYVLMVKKYQKELKQQVEKIFSVSRVQDECQTSGIGPGRIGNKQCHVIDHLNFFDDK